MSTPKRNLTFTDKFTEAQDSLIFMGIVLPPIVLFFLLLFGDGKNLFVKETDWAEAEAKNIVSTYNKGTKKNSTGTWTHTFYFEHPNGKQECSVSQRTCGYVHTIYYHKKHPNLYTIKNCDISGAFIIAIVFTSAVFLLWILFWIYFFQKRNFFFLLQYGEVISSKKNYIIFKSSIAGHKSNSVYITMSLQSEFEYGTFSYLSQPHELQFLAPKTESLSLDVFISDKLEDDVIYKSFVGNGNVAFEEKSTENNSSDKTNLPVSVLAAVNQLKQRTLQILFDPQNPNNNVVLLKKNNKDKKIGYLTNRNPTVEMRKSLLVYAVFFLNLLPILVWLYYRYF